MPAVRVQLKPDQLGAAFHLAGVTPTSRSPLRSIGAVSTTAAARKALAGTGLVGRADGLIGDAAAAMAVLADPRLAVVVVANRANGPEWAETTLLSPGAAGPYVLLADDGAVADLAIVPTLSGALVLLDELIGVSLLPATDGFEPVELDLAGFAALVAASDVARATRLERALDRSTDGAPVTFTAADLDAALDRGMAGTDARWAVDAARVISPPVFATAAGRMADGLKSLAGAGLVAAKGRSAAFTAAGRAAADGLGRLVGSASITVAFPPDDGGARGVSHVGVFRAVDSIWMVPWSTIGADDATVSVYQTSTTTALRLLQALVVPVPPPSTAERAAPATAKKATAKKATAKKAAAAPVPATAGPPHPAPAAPWAATHLVPAGGLDAYHEPDASASPVASLDAALAVQVDEQLGAWAHVICSNGWQAWVDGRDLEPTG
jgi:hypothetical protein